MVAGLLIYLWGGRYLPPEQPRATPEQKATREGFNKQTILLLLGIAIAVTVFRSAYEQVGNTVALWADSGVDRQAGSFAIPMTWFQSLNPLFVMVMTPPLLAYWKRRAMTDPHQALVKRMALGALIVGASYALLTCVSVLSDGHLASWVWLVLFFAILTFGELFILPTGLGLFARLAPPHLGATTVAAWFLVIFTGSLSAGFVGTLWSRLAPPQFFVLLAILSTIAAGLLFAIGQKADGAPKRTDQPD